MLQFGVGSVFRRIYIKMGRAVDFDSDRSIFPLGEIPVLVGKWPTQFPLYLRNQLLPFFFLIVRCRDGTIDNTTACPSVKQCES